MKKVIAFPILLLLAAWAAVSFQNADPPRNPQAPPGAQAAAPLPPPADLKPLLEPRPSEMRLVAQRYAADRADLNRFYHAPTPRRFARLKRFGLDWASALDALKTDGLSAAAVQDLSALKKTVQTDLSRIDTEAAAAAQIEPLVPFAAGIAGLEESRMLLETMSAEKAALALAAASDRLGQIRARLEAGLTDKDRLEGLPIGQDAFGRAAESTEALHKMVRDWFNFYNDYDPSFSWWLAQPFREIDKSLSEYAAFLRDKMTPAATGKVGPAPAIEIAACPAPDFAEVPDLRALMAYPSDEMRGIVQKYRAGFGRGGRGGPDAPAGTPPAPDIHYYAGWLSALKKLDFDKLSRPAQIDYLNLRNAIEIQIRRAESKPAAGLTTKQDASGIKGRPIGREALMLSLAEELIPYTPEQLVALAEKQFAWCESEMLKASHDLGCGDDWKAALEKVKESHVPPGGQPDLIRDLMFQAVDYLRAHDLITVPEIERETLRMVMMTPQQQLYNPFFTGGDEISVSYPTSTMTTRQKLESMRGNNPGFAHATAFHEMIPGHNMQAYMAARFGGGRGFSGTAFWTEGWAVYWETVLYDLGFDATPEQRIGALFWRMHRCARIVFSLKFHLGQWSPQECIDYLVDKVGHERENAAAEVRRSFEGGYGPLYQAAYLLGALQLRELRKEMVDSGAMDLKRFHDAIIQMGNMPIALLRLALGKQKLGPNMSLEWKCFGPNPGRER